MASSGRYFDIMAFNDGILPGGNMFWFSDSIALLRRRLDIMTSMMISFREESSILSATGLKLHLLGQMLGHYDFDDDEP